MKKIVLFLLLTMCLSIKSYAESGKAYLDRFMKYTAWSKSLPLIPSEEFLTFINQDTPLAKKLMANWLYQLARNKDWVNYRKYYKHSKDLNLQCYAQFSLYLLGNHHEAINGAKNIWLTGDSTPKACDELFSYALKNHEIADYLITQRLNLVLAKSNISLASYLLKQYRPARVDEIKLLLDIDRRPKSISSLRPNELHSLFYLYGLNKLVTIDMTEALKIWDNPKSKIILNESQQQTFLANIAFYKAIRDNVDAPKWFAKVKPEFYNETLISWQIRYNLKYRQWSEVEKLINKAPEKDSPCWQYWLARAKEGQGQKAEALELYKTLALNRNYYGFLASRRLNIKFNFQNEPATENINLLAPYKPFTDEIKKLFIAKQTETASRMLNDFVSELPKRDKSALAYWLQNNLMWNEKSLHLSNNDELINQLSLRFPLAYKNSIKNYAKNYQIKPELIYAIIRQESSFRGDAISSAGAMGLMQIMPNTAKVISKSEKISYKIKPQLFVSDKNINIGTAYLQQLAKRFDKHPILMAAAYNAGPKQVNNWLKTHQPNDMDIWIETLPWLETRNYLKNIIAFYAVYQFRLREKPDLSPFMKAFSS